MQPYPHHEKFYNTTAQSAIQTQNQNCSTQWTTSKWTCTTHSWKLQD